MKNYTTKNILKLLGLVLIISIVITLIIEYPNYGSSYAIGFSTGFTFGKAVKLLGGIGLMAYGISTLRKKRVKTLE